MALLLFYISNWEFMSPKKVFDIMNVDLYKICSLWTMKISVHLMKHIVKLFVCWSILWILLVKPYDFISIRLA